MAEARGAKEDGLLGTSYRAIALNGKAMSVPMRSRLTSLELKLRRKEANEAGLQIADLVAHPAWRTALARRAGEPLKDTFGGRVGQLLIDQKWRRVRGAIETFGVKHLP